MRHYRLVAEFLALLRSVEDGGELTVDQLTTIEKMESISLPVLMNQYAALLRELTSGEKHARDEAAWFTARARQCAVSGHLVKERMVALMKTFELKELDTDLFHIALRTSPPSVCITDVDFDPAKLMATDYEELVAPVKYNLDSAKVKEWFQRDPGSLPPGVTVTTNAQHVRLTPR